MLEKLSGEGKPCLGANDDITREELLRASGVFLSTVRLNKCFYSGDQFNWSKEVSHPQPVVHDSVIFKCHS